MKVETLADNKFCLKEAQNKQGLIQHSLTNGHVSAYSRLMYKKHREIVGVTLQLICLFFCFFFKECRQYCRSVIISMLETPLLIGVL